MKILSLALVLALSGCAGFDFSLDCRLTENRLVCNGEFPDGGNRETDSGIDSSVSDSGVDASIPDAGLDSGQNSGASDMRVDSGTDAGQKVDTGVTDAGILSPVDAGSVVVVPATGVFRVVGSKLFDPNGVEFRMRGTNRVHQDTQSQYLGQQPSNTTRTNLYFFNDTARNIRDITESYNGGTTTNGKAVQVPGLWGGPAGELTCSNSDTAFNAAIDLWIREIPKYKTIEKYMLLNPANEWGNGVGQWRSAYVAAIPKLRAAGWTGTIVVDAPGCGQDYTAVVQAGKDVLAADPLKNVIFDVHLYGLYADTVGGVPAQWGGQWELVPAFDALKATGLAIVIGEIGPGRNIGPSPTMVAPGRIVALAEERGFSWLLWASDDHSQANQRSNNADFGMITQNDIYRSEADLTDWGREALRLWRLYGAKPASVF
jgi:mannan endo-1,4-beta-mannosidase